MRIGFLSRLAAISLTALCITVGAWAAKNARPAWVIADSVNVRSGPSTSSDKVASLSRGSKVYVTAFTNKWCKAKLPNGNWGWIAEGLLQFSASAGRAIAADAHGSSGASSGGNPAAWISESAVNVRSGPGPGANSFGTLSAGTKVYVMARESGWVKVRTPGGSGWVRGDMVVYDASTGRHLAAQNKGGDSGIRRVYKAYCTGDSVRLRDDASTDGDVKATLSRGQTLYVVAREGSWARVRVHNGTWGYIHTSLLKYDREGSATPAARPPASQTVSQVAAWTAEDTVNVRYGPGLDEEVKLQLAKGTYVRIVSIQGHWCMVKTEAGQEGWVAGWVLNFAKPSPKPQVQVAAATRGDLAYVCRPAVNFRSGPSTDADDVGTLDLGTPVRVLQRGEDWCKVNLESGKVGWIARKYLDTRLQSRLRREQFRDTARGIYAGASEAIGNAVGAGKAFVETALQYCGRPYARGGDDPSAFDCSGFVMYVLGQHGIDVSHDSRDQFRRGTPIARDSLQPGDVVFFENTYRPGISHVGIYMGDNKFVHAANPSSGVKVSDLNEDYYARKYAGARRMR
jgi:N-acetylmuramoyl-L-alanine amidase